MTVFFSFLQNLHSFIEGFGSVLGQKTEFCALYLTLREIMKF